MDFILNILSYWNEALIVILVLGGLIFVHELGHFIANRALGIGVVTFSIGMGPKLASFKRGKTEYRLSWFPIGGYVAAVGEYGPEVEELGFTQEEAIGGRPAWQRLIMALAGPLMNLLLAWLIYWGIAMFAGVGIPVPTIGELSENGAATTAGMRVGDTITSIDGVAVEDWNQVPVLIDQAQGAEVTVTVDREGENLTLRMTPRLQTRQNMFGQEEEAWLIGVVVGNEVRYEPLGFFAAAKQGLNQTWYMIEMIGISFKMLFTGQVAADDVGGPIMIAQMIGAQAQVGLMPLLMLAAMISINLGLLNLLPIPVLDGGTILFSLIEMIFRKPVPEKVQGWSMQIGATLLILLMVFVTFNDVMRWVPK